ncbi:hypothetical protein Taro_020165 [Colocasia esculenta]|uniref:Uncharacterized protein n=1 Tax=Colocasia esculenta TaxID=4460 RepID=A0A843UVJ2_COLES|nr:hypothetical protein [Colocasia esculenta]
MRSGRADEVSGRVDEVFGLADEVSCIRADEVFGRADEVSGRVDEVFGRADEVNCIRADEVSDWWRPTSRAADLLGCPRIIGPPGFEAEELGVNIVCREAHQPGCKRPDPLPLTSCKRQSMLPPTGESEEDVSRPSFGSELRRSGTGSVPPAV